MGTITCVDMMTGTFEAVDSRSMYQTPVQSTLRHSYPLPALCMVSMALSPASTNFPTDMPPIQWAALPMSSSRPHSRSLPSQPPSTPQTLRIAARLTCLRPTAVPSPAMLNLPPMRRWMHMINQIKPARYPARHASLTPRHKCRPGSLTMAGRRSSVCRLMSEWTRTQEDKQLMTAVWID